MTLLHDDRKVQDIPLTLYCNHGLTSEPVGMRSLNVLWNCTTGYEETQFAEHQRISFLTK